MTLGLHVSIFVGLLLAPVWTSTASRRFFLNQHFERHEPAQVCAFGVGPSILKQVTSHSVTFYKAISGCQLQTPVFFFHTSAAKRKQKMTLQKREG